MHYESLNIGTPEQPSSSQTIIYSSEFFPPDSFGTASFKKYLESPVVRPLGFLTQPLDTAGIYADRGRFRQLCRPSELARLARLGITTTGQLLATPKDYRTLTRPAYKLVEGVADTLTRNLLNSGHAQAYRLIMGEKHYSPPLSSEAEAARNKLIDSQIANLDQPLQACLRTALGLDNGQSLNWEDTTRQLKVTHDLVREAFGKLPSFNTPTRSYDKFKAVEKKTVARDLAGITCRYDYEQRLVEALIVLRRGQTDLPVSWLGLDNLTLAFIFGIENKRGLDWNQFFRGRTIYDLLETPSTLPPDVAKNLSAALFSKGLAQPRALDFEI